MEEHNLIPILRATKDGEDYYLARVVVNNDIIGGDAKLLTNRLVIAKVQELENWVNNKAELEDIVIQEHHYAIFPAAKAGFDFNEFIRG